MNAIKRLIQGFGQTSDVLMLPMFDIFENEVANH